MINKFISLFLAILFFAACKEQPIVIPPLKAPTLGNRKILVEEFTGVQCVNCPDGSAEIESLKNLYSENLVSVSIHAGFFSTPFVGHSDFRTQDGNEITAYICSPDLEPDGYPAASINRTLFGGESFRYVNRSKWAAYIQQESVVEPKISVAVQNTYDAATRQLTVTTTLVPTLALQGSHNVTVLLTENDIIDKQKTGAGEVENYKHKHVFRKCLSAATGTEIGNGLKAGIPIVKTFTLTLPAAWKAENCEIVAFAHRNDGTRKEVLQVAEKKIL